MLPDARARPNRAVYIQPMNCAERVGGFNGETVRGIRMLKAQR
jgi:hypothetical protein